jgi:hypothetical protein
MKGGTELQVPIVTSELKCPKLKNFFCAEQGERIEIDCDIGVLTGVLKITNT